MAYSRIEKINKKFRTHMEQVKIYKDLKSDKQYATLLGCSVRTIVNMRADPFSVQARWVLLVEDYWAEVRAQYNLDWSF